MIDNRKYMLARIFIKKCTVLSITKDHLDFKFKWCENTFNVSDEKVEKIKKKFTIDDYIDRMIPVISKHFSTEELQSLIKFYSSDVGKKMLDLSFLKEVGEIGDDIGVQIEQEFVLNNDKNKNL